jgi:hypothetical protein
MECSRSTTCLEPERAAYRVPGSGNPCAGGDPYHPPAFKVLGQV